jgi:hypothetical protein
MERGSPPDKYGRFTQTRLRSQESNALLIEAGNLPPQ